MRHSSYAHAIKEANNNMGRVTTVHYGGRPLYDITIGHDFQGISKVCRFLGTDTKRVCIVTDSNVARCHMESLLEILKDECRTVETFTIPAGEENKQLSNIMKLYAHLIEAKFDRSDMLFALGGGVVGDMTGFAAATFLRGISFVQVPTSLLAMVDSSIGGKTGVDFDSYKNMVGAFHQPKAVYMNLQTLDTLPEREFYSGFGEIIKHGLIKDAAYYRWIRENAENILKKQPQALEELIYQSNEVKRHVVEQDPEEKGERALLNFGHTVGHSIEKFFNFQLLHGECVALGMVAAGEISEKRGLITKQEQREMEQLLAYYHLPIGIKPDTQKSFQYSYGGLDIDKVLEYMKNDKKMISGKLKFILLDGIGDAVIDKTVTDGEIKDALVYLGGNQ